VVEFTQELISLSLVEITLANVSGTLLIVTNEHIFDFCSSVSLLLLEIGPVLTSIKELLGTFTGR